MTKNNTPRHVSVLLTVDSSTLTRKAVNEVKAIISSIVEKEGIIGFDVEHVTDHEKGGEIIVKIHSPLMLTKVNTRKFVLTLSEIFSQLNGYTPRFIESENS